MLRRCPTVSRRTRHQGGCRAGDAPVPGAYSGVFAVDLEGSYIGAVSVERRDDDRPGHLLPTGGELEVSYTLLPAYWGLGLASEAVEAALAWTWRQFPTEPVVVCTQVANERALALAKRLGFAEIATFSEYGAEQWLGVRWPDGRDDTN